MVADDRERLQPPFPHRLAAGEDRRRPEHDLARDHGLGRGDRRLVGDVHQPGAGRLLEQGRSDMHGRAVADRAIGDLAGRLLRGVDQVLQGVDIGIRPDHEQVGRRGDLRDGGEVLHRVVLQLLAHRRRQDRMAGDDEVQRVAVGRRLGDDGRADRPRGAAAIVDHDALAEQRLHLVEDDPRRDVGDAAGREADDGPDRTCSDSCPAARGPYRQGPSVPASPSRPARAARRPGVSILMSRSRVRPRGPVVHDGSGSPDRSYPQRARHSCAAGPNEGAAQTCLPSEEVARSICASRSSRARVLRWRQPKVPRYARDDTRGMTEPVPLILRTSQSATGAPASRR